MSRDPSPIRVLTVDDHALLREGIAPLVNAESDMKLSRKPATDRKRSKSFDRTGRMTAPESSLHQSRFLNLVPIRIREAIITSASLRNRL